MLQLDDIIQKVVAYNPRANIDLIRDAYVFSAKAHEGQKRLSGHPFVLHPLEVANTLAEMKLDAASVAAGILHDTIEDTKATKEEITQKFGKDIAELVDGVTKISQIEFKTPTEKQSENFRKMIIAMSKDIRVVLIKLADRLNNLRTLQFMPEEKQQKIAQETLDIFAPLANRLGIQWMKVQLEDLSFRFLKPDVYRQIEKKIARVEKTHQEYMDRVDKAIRHHFKDAIPKFEIWGRMKHVYSIYKKMERQNINFEQVHDLLAFRITTDTVEECYEALGLLHSMWKPVPGRFKDYLAMPKANNYRSVHTTVICLDGERVEFQIRTREMHDIAERGIASHWKYKEDGKLDLESEKTYLWLRELMDWNKELNDSLEFLDTVKMDLFSQDIYVFTPKGDLRALPFGATPIDFAYSIHSDLGNHCTGAKVNGRLVPLATKLESGDEVEVVIDPEQLPSKDWLPWAASSRAKARIRQYLKLEQQKKSLRVGQKIFDGECAKYDLNPSKVLKMASFEEYIQKKGISGNDSVYSALAYGKLSMPAILAAVAPDKKPIKDAKPSLLSRIFKKVSEETKDLVLISNMEDLLVTFAKCCAPVCGDPIIGFVTRGRGVSVHRAECGKVPDIDPERRVDATWNPKAKVIRTALIRIVCDSRPGMLAKITQAISDKKINITKAIVRTTRDEKAMVSMDISVTHVSELHTVLHAMEKLKGVISVERQMV